MSRRRFGAAVVALTALMAGTAIVSQEQAASSTSKPPSVALLLYRGCEDACIAFRDWLTQRGISLEIRSVDAGVDPERLPAIVQAVRAEDPEVVVTWGTQTALAAFGALGAVDPATHFTETPGVFMIVSQPVAAGLIASPEMPRRNLTGTRYLTDEADQIEAARVLLSNRAEAFDKIGVIYTPTEPNARINVERLQAAAEMHDITVIRRPLPVDPAGTPDPAAIPVLVADLADEAVDLIYQPADTVMNVNRLALGAAARAHGIPVFAAGEAPVRDGVAFAGLVYGYSAVGRRTAEIVARILDGERPEAIPVGAPGQPDLLFNTAAAEALGLTPPTDVLPFLRYTGK